MPPAPRKTLALTVVPPIEPPFTIVAATPVAPTALFPE